MSINRLTCHYLAAVLLSHKISFNKPVSQQVRLNGVLESYSSKDTFFPYLAFHLCLQQSPGDVVIYWNSSELCVNPPVAMCVQY